MNTSEQEREWEHAARNPELPGEDLECFEMHGSTCMYDSDNPQAYIIGEPVEVGRTE